MRILRLFIVCEELSECVICRKAKSTPSLLQLKHGNVTKRKETSIDLEEKRNLKILSHQILTDLSSSAIKQKRMKEKRKINLFDWSFFESLLFLHSRVAFSTSFEIKHRSKMWFKIWFVSGNWLSSSVFRCLFIYLGRIKKEILKFNMIKCRTSICIMRFPFSTFSMFQIIRKIHWKNWNPKSQKFHQFTVKWCTWIWIGKLKS